MGEVGSFGYSGNGFSSTLRVSFGLFLIPNLEGLCVLFSVKRPFLPWWNVFLKHPAPRHMTQSWKPLFSGSPTSYVFIFPLKHKTKPTLPVSGLGMWRVTQQGPLANRSEGASESCPLAALPWEEGCWDGILVPWKEENGIQAVMRKRPLLVLIACLFFLCLFAPYPRLTKTRLPWSLYQLSY